jgi:hypothetical protein
MIEVRQDFFHVGQQINFFALQRVLEINIKAHIY